MRKELLFFSALALAIAGCSNHDEVENIGDPGSNPLLTENSVSFTNNTTLTIGGDVKSRMGL